MSNTSASDQPDSPDAPVADTPATGVRRARPPRRAPKTQAPRQRRGPKSLIETSGPEPASDLAAVRLTVGVIGGTHGVHGELKLKLLTDHPEHLATIREVFLSENETPTAVESFRFHGDQGLIRLAGIDNPEDGKRLGGLKVRIRGTDAAPLAEGEYFLFQLIGLKAELPSGEPLGEVSDLMETGAHDVLVLTTTAGGEMLVPITPNSSSISCRPKVGS
jgi:16S rRNA processing protein RimM